MQTVLYIPGLGDAIPTRWLVKRWKKSNREVITFDTRWHSNETFEEKYKRLSNLMVELKNRENLIIVGVSAGGALANKLLSDYPFISGAHIISGKVKGSNTIGKSYQKRAPALLDAVKVSEETLKNASQYEGKLTIYRPWIEWTVPLKDMLVGKAKRKRIPGIGHPIGIAVAMLFYVP